MFHWVVQNQSIFLQFYLKYVNVYGVTNEAKPPIGNLAFCI